MSYYRLQPPLCIIYPFNVFAASAPALLKYPSICNYMNRDAKRLKENGLRTFLRFSALNDLKL